MHARGSGGLQPQKTAEVEGKRRGNKGRGTAKRTDKGLGAAL